MQGTDLGGAGAAPERVAPAAAGSLITVEGLAKHYRVHQRSAGVAAALRSLLRRRWETVRAVDGISLSIAPGERIGFLGPNGAGKTTTLKMLAGLLHPTAGTVSVGGFRPAERSRDFLHAITLVAGQKQQLLWDLPPADTFELNRAIYEIPRPVFRQRLDELVELLEVGEVMRRPARQLSLGERMKCELAAALLHRPRVLFLDEPTIGLDITMQASLRRFIATYNERHGATVLLTSHYMADVAALCPRIVVINHGRIIYDGSLPQLVRRTRPEKRVELHLERAIPRPELEALGARLVSFEGTQAVFHVEQGDLKRLVTQALAALPVVDLSVADAPLETVLADLFAATPAPAAPGSPAVVAPP